LQVNELCIGPMVVGYAWIDPVVKAASFNHVLARVRVRLADYQ
jgi:hypothetical protein